MKLSIIIPTYRDNDRLETCLAAIEGQIQGRQVEVLVVDNFGDASVADIVSRYPHAKYLVETAPGSYAARNAALKLATGGAVAFTDSDCIPAGGWVPRIIHALERSTADIIAGRVDVFPTDPKSPNGWEISDMIFGFPIKQRIYGGGGGVTANLVVRSNAFVRVGLFKAEMLSGGDGEWCARARVCGLVIAYDHNLVVMHPARGTARSQLGKAKRIVGGLASGRRAKAGDIVVACSRLPLPPYRDFMFAMRKYQSGDFGIWEIAQGLSVRSIVHYYMKFQQLMYLLSPDRAKRRV